MEKNDQALLTENSEICLKIVAVNINSDIHANVMTGHEHKNKTKERII
jgi:hypothetical protein